MSFYQLTSTMIDDETLIEELKKYGENVPIGGSSQSSSSRKKSVGGGGGGGGNQQLTEKNREIYLKKLNHYKAREKAETNPSKYLKQQQQQQINTTTTTTTAATKTKTPTNRQRANQQHHRLQVEEQQEQENEEVVELQPPSSASANNTTCEYVQMANAQTSPMGSSMLGNDMTSSSSQQQQIIHDAPSIIYPPTSSNYHHRHQQQQQPPSPQLDYVSLKEKIDIDKTLSKYRSDISNILNNTRLNQTNLPSVRKYLLSDDTAAKKNRLHEDNEDDVQIIDDYCPKPAPASGYFSKRSSSSSSNNNRRSIFELFRSTNNHHQTQSPSVISINKQQQQQRGWWSSSASNVGLLVAKSLPYIAAILFTLILLQYATMKLKNSTSTPTNKMGDQQQQQQDSSFETNNWSFWPINGGGFSSLFFSTKQISNNHCPDIKDTKCSQTKLILRELIDYLRARSGAIDCLPSFADDSKQLHPTFMHLTVANLEKCVHINQLIEHLKQRKNLVDEKHHHLAVDSMLKAVLRNPQWNLHLFNESYMETNDPNEVIYLMSTISMKPFMCRMNELMQNMFVKVLTYGSALVTIFLGYVLVRVYRRKLNENDEAFYNLVNQVVAMVEKQYELSVLDANIKPYVAISHIFDALVEPSQRATQKKVWKRVIKFIEDHESRIHLETQFIDGEETPVWKWIVPKVDSALALANSFKYVKTSSGNANDCIGLGNSTMIMNSPLSPSSAAGAATVEQGSWQGDAFSKSEKMINSPTPCLKIRNMFDASQFEKEDAQQFAAKIHNDILDKCSAYGRQLTNSSSVSSFPNQYILHISCDRKSKEGCVYVKCVSNEAAGHCYQALNGTWYNGKLLNVKYLRIDRYLERFPESRSFTQPLQRLRY